MGNLHMDMKFGDTRPVLRTPLLDGSVPVPLASASEVRLLMVRPDLTLLNKAITIEDPPEDGIVSYQWVDGDLPEVGIYVFELEVTYPDGTKQTFPVKGRGIISVSGDLG